MMIREPGNYLAEIASAAVTESKTSQLAQWEVKFRCTDVWDEAVKEWRPLHGNENEITAWIFLEKKDFSLNEFNVKQIVDAVGWDGTSFVSLHEKTEFPKVQIVVRNERGNDGKDRLKVAFLNHKDRKVGGREAKPMEMTAMQKLDARHKRNLEALKVQKKGGALAVADDVIPDDDSIPF